MFYMNCQYGFKGKAALKVGIHVLEFGIRKTGFLFTLQRSKKENPWTFALHFGILKADCSFIEG